MSQNFYVVPERDYFTIEDDMVKIKQNIKLMIMKLSLFLNMNLIFILM